MYTSTITKKEITSRVVFNQFRESMETSVVEVITFPNGTTSRFDSFISEVCNERWCTVAEEIAIRKTSSVAKKQDFVNKYAEIFLNVPGSGRA